jgi:hypothetical protein
MPKKQKIIFSATEQQQRNLDILIVIGLTGLFITGSYLFFGTNKTTEKNQTECIKAIDILP